MSQNGIKARCERHSSVGQWTLTTTRVGIFAPNLETKTLKYVYMHLHVDVSMDTYPTCHPNLNKTIFKLVFFQLGTTTFRQLDHIFSNLCWKEETFLLISSQWSWFPYTNGWSYHRIVGDNGLNLTSWCTNVCI